MSFFCTGLRTNHVDKIGGGRVVKMSMFVYEGEGVSGVCLRRQNTYQFQRILIVKYKFVARIVHIFTNPIIRDCRCDGIGC